MAQTPQVVIADESKDTATEKIIDDNYPRTKTIKVKKVKLRKKLLTDIENVPGVRKIVLGEISQKVTRCVVGEDVTSEKPWTFVEKEDIMSNLELHADSSEFLPIKGMLEAFPRNEVLIGYIPNESRDFDEFFICLTERATDNVKLVIELQRIEQEKRLESSVIREVRPWKSLGTEEEIEEVTEKNNRPLLEVEVESKYPILPFKVRFCKKRCEEMRDGYMELRGVDPAAVYINCRRIDNFTQVAPFLVPHEAQTDCKYPTNEACQYQYEFEVPKEVNLKPFVTHWKEHLDKFLDVLISNAHLDLYLDDYENLKINLDYEKTLYIVPPKEYLSFIDVNICKGKQISAAKWHPLWSGVAAIAYVDTCTRLWVQNPEIDENANVSVHRTNPVLLWSFADDLKPKLVLETHREVTALAFCPFDENLLVGGCSNGQIILWDIKDRLQKVEERQILTIAQQKYRRYMFSLMQWMKNVFDIALVKPTVITHLEYSHKGPIFSLEWVAPYYKHTKTGRVNCLEPGVHSLQFISSSEDGTILIWDLHSKPPVASLRGPGKLHRVKTKPGEDIPDQSPYKPLNLNLKPIYRINVSATGGGRLSPISALGHKSVALEYTKKAQKKEDLRETYEVNLQMPDKCSFQNEAYVGTMQGQLVQVKWEGQQFDSGEIVNKEDAVIKNCGKYHDGPITSVSRSPTTNAILTVGGKIFALWRQDFKSFPILWRKGKSIYTYGVWGQMETSKIQLLRMDGYVEMWFLCYNSNKPIYTVLVSTGPLTTTATSMIEHDAHTVLGLADHTGCFRSYVLPSRKKEEIRNDEEKMNKFLDREIQRKKMLLKWQADWNEKYRQSLLEQKLEKESSSVMIHEPSKRKSVNEESEPPPLKREKSKLLEQAGRRYVEFMKKQNAEHQQNKILETVFEKKQIKKEQLEIDSIPLKKAQEETEIRKKKQRKRINESEKVFKDTTTMLFPDAVQEKPPRPADPYVTGHIGFDKKACFKYYQDNAPIWKKYVEKNAFQYVFNWKRVLDAGEERRKKICGYYDTTTHWRRIERVTFEKRHSVQLEETVASTISVTRSEATTVDDTESYIFPSESQ